MATSFNPRTSGAVNHNALLPLLLLLLLVVALPWQKASAQQRNAASDWHVPPPKTGVKPLKGQAAKPAMLSITDVAAPAMPQTPAVDVPQLAAISMVPPHADQPGQPGVSDADLQLMPMPTVPETPPMPERTIQDAPLPQHLDVPAPDAPEMPSLPPAPTAGTNAAKSKNTLPSLPSVNDQVPFAMPQHTPVASWSTPGIPESDNFRIETPGVKNTGRGKQGNRHKKPKK